jgi:hypothetical protein
LIRSDHDKTTHDKIGFSDIRNWHATEIPSYKHTCDFSNLPGLSVLAHKAFPRFVMSNIPPSIPAPVTAVRRIRLEWVEIRTVGLDCGITVKVELVYPEEFEETLRLEISDSGEITQVRRWERRKSC